MSKVKGSVALVIAVTAMMMFLTGCETTKHAEVMGAEELATLAKASGSEGAGEGGEQGGIPLAGQGMSEGSLSVGEGASTGTELAQAEFGPEGPPLPTLRGGQEGIDYSVSGTAGGTTEAESTVTSETGKQPSSPERSNLIGEYPTGERSPSSLFGPEAPPQAYLRDGAETFGGSPAEEAIGVEGGEAVKSVESGEAGPSGFEGQQFVQALKPSDFVPEPPPQPSLGDRGETFTPRTETTTKPSGSKHEEVELPAQSEPEESIKPLTRSDLGGPQGGGKGLGLEDAFFDFDKYFIRADAIPTLQANAQLLNAKYRDSSVLIEGHCDERGTSEYNLVLGERRAKAVRNYLVDLGVSSSRIQIVSYGKERPFCSESNESCWQQNRRGHFVLQ